MAIASLLFACTSENPRQTTGGQPADADGGPLQSPSLMEGVSIYRPKDAQASWWATIGGDPLCLSDTGNGVEITSVTYQYDVKPQKTITYLRTVPAIDERIGPGDWQPLATRVGIPSHFTDGPPKVARGEFTDAAGAIVDVPCGDSEAVSRYQQLVTVMEVGDAGGEYSGYDIHYTAGGQPHILTVNYVNTACGTDTDPEYCTRGQS